MDFRLSEAQRLVQDTARDFVDKEIVPHVRDWEAKGEVPRSLYTKMAALGFLGAPVPEKYGGAGGGHVPFAPPPRGGNRGGSCGWPPTSRPHAPPGPPPGPVRCAGPQKRGRRPPPRRGG